MRSKTSSSTWSASPLRASLSARFFRTVTGWYVKNLDAENVDISRSRWLWTVGVHFLIKAFGVRVDTAEMAGVGVEWATPRKAADSKVLLYIHGGAFVMGSPRTHRQFVSHLARVSGVRTVSVDYRLAPEARFSAGLDDCVAVYDALLEQGIRSSDIIISGDSAGGNLAVATMLALRDAGKPLPNAAVLLSPIIDLTASGESMQTRAELDPWFRPENVKIVADHYCEPSQVTHPLVSPLFANFDGLPPMYIIVGDREILLSDSQRLADLQIAAGGEAILDVWPEMWHVFPIFTQKMPESRRALREIGAYVRERLA